MQLELIQNKIYELRKQKIMLDFDLADLYDTETKRLNEAVKRNSERFPERFMFRLTIEEWSDMRSQIATGSRQSRRNTFNTPFAFTEHGVTMLASVLKSQKAIQMNIAIVDAFIALKRVALHTDLLDTRLKELEIRYDQRFEDISEALNYLLEKDRHDNNYRKRKQIGYRTES